MAVAIGSPSAVGRQCWLTVRLQASAWPLWPGQAELRSGSRLLPGGSSEVGGDDVGRVAVQAAAGTVVADRGPRVSVGSGFLNISQGDASIESCRYECVPERVRPDGLADPSAASDPSDNPGGTVPVQPPAIGGQEDRPVTALTDGQVDRPRRARRQRDGHDLSAFASDGQRPVATFGAQRLDAGAGGLRNPQPIQGEQADQRVLSRRTEPGGNQEATEFVAVQSGRVRLIIQPRTPDMGGR